jgi:hypothetical protein
MANKEKNLNLVKETVLNNGESVQYSIFGTYETKTLGNNTVKNGILVATEKRIIFYAKRFSGFDLENFDYSKISTFELSKKLIGNVLTIYSSGNKVNVKWINDAELDDFVTYVNDRMQSKNYKEATIDNEEQNLKKIKQLKELLDMEAITQEEFDTKKSRLLGL